MLKIFYIGASGSSAGVLRAVLCEARFADIASTQPFSYVGTTFPSQPTGETANTIVQVLSEEGPEASKSGFYSIKRSPLQFETILKTLRG
jgi:hypothetical protein